MKQWNGEMGTIGRSKYTEVDGLGVAACGGPEASVEATRIQLFETCPSMYLLIYNISRCFIF